MEMRTNTIWRMTCLHLKVIFGHIPLWCAINIIPSSEILFQLPPVAQIIPLLVSIWYVLMDRGDTIAKLDDIYQVRIRIRL